MNRRSLLIYPSILAAFIGATLIGSAFATTPGAPNPGQADPIRVNGWKYRTGTQQTIVMAAGGSQRWTDGTNTLLTVADDGADAELVIPDGSGLEITDGTNVLFTFFDAGAGGNIRFTSGNGVGTASGTNLIMAGTAAYTRFVGYVTDADGDPATRIEASVDLTTAGRKIVSFGDNSATSYAEKASIDLNGMYEAQGLQVGCADGRICDAGSTSSYIELNSGIELRAIQGQSPAMFYENGVEMFRIQDQGSDGGAEILVPSGKDFDFDLTSGGLNIYTGSTLLWDWTTSGAFIAEAGTYSAWGGSKGALIGMVEEDYSLSDTVATDTTPVSVNGISLAIDANDVYSIECEGRLTTANATSGPQPGLDLPASATQEASCSIASGNAAVDNRTFTADDGSCANTVGGLTTPGGYFKLVSTVTNSTNAGNIILRLRSENTDDVTAESGIRCRSTRIVNN